MLGDLFLLRKLLQRDSRLRDGVILDTSRSAESSGSTKRIVGMQYLHVAMFIH
jgi:hypothetical protein